ncbi:MAG TPA: hypothetical protein VF170_13185 [Planctomycetaceae bacterium]
MNAVAAPVLLKQATCPHCWTAFRPEQTLFVAEHVELLGDARLGPEAQTRFLPTRFNVQGDAIDAKGFPCSQIACPQCHLVIPRACLELPPLFLSIFGAPGSGKSYYLAAMTWQLRASLPDRFRIGFGDADPAMNRTLVEYEESLFVNPHAEELIPLGRLIRKTETQGDLYNAVAFGGQSVLYSRPFLFTLRPQEDHPAATGPAAGSRLVCLYDNAGESFQPGADTAAAPVTRHLAHSRALLFVFDPTQDARFRKAAGIGGSAAQLSRQEPILQEAAARVRRHAGLRHSEKHQRPLIVVLSKYDRWSGLLNEDVPAEPFCSYAPSEGLPFALDIDRVEHRSRVVREVLRRLCPEIVHAAEGFCERVVYVPTSAVGYKAEIDPQTGQSAIRPADTEPHWVTVPFLYALAATSGNLVPVARRRSAAQTGR